MVFLERNLLIRIFFLRYLYGFEEYCTSANIEFQMALPEKVTSKPCKDCEKEKELKMREDPEQDVKEIKADKEERKQEEVAAVQQEDKKLTENDNESKENDKPTVTVKYFNVHILLIRSGSVLIIICVRIEISVMDLKQDKNML